MDTDEESDHLDVVPAEDITVAIFCALPYESAAVKYTFDKEVECRPKTIGPRKYVYSFGVIGEHSVVIARPSQMGTVKAAQCAATVSQQFPNIRFALLVGIGAGVPNSSTGGSKHDIRLGDIAVSIPQDGHPGVVEYDYGKYEVDGTFVLKGSLNKPHPILISADGALQEDEIMNKSRLWKILKRIIEQPGYARPKTDDILFDEAFQHLKGDGCTECLKCEHKKDVVRDIKAARPVVHRGLILSGSGVVKNPEDRLRLRRGHTDAICFEMEAAGIIDEIPCLVVRGICDYADTHKQDGWHYYAAAVAAAYGKALLLKIYSEDIQEAESMKETMSKILLLSVDTKTRVQSLQTFAHLDKTIQWLSAPDPSTNLNTARELHQPGTGQWLLDSDKYRSWKATRGSFLWLYGIPGCGKTILSSTIVADLDKDLTTSQSLLYFYFSFTDIEKRSAENAVRSLIDQLYHKNVDTREVVDTLYTTYEKGRRQPSNSSLQNTLQLMIAKCQDVWVILDGIDECETRGKKATNSIVVWVKELRCSLPNIHLLITSRPEDDIKSSIETYATTDEIVSLQSCLVADDIDTYIRTKVEQMDRWYTQPEIQTLIVTTLSERANGMFRWVVCQFDALDHCLSREEVLKELATLPPTLDDTYTRAFERIYPKYKPKAIRLLQLLVYSNEPISIEAAVDAIAVEPRGEPRFDKRNRMPLSNEITRYCSSFVSLTSSSATKKIEIQLAHFSVQEYLLSDRLNSSLRKEFDKTAAAAAIVDLCLSYLLALGPLSILELVTGYPFARFSVNYWSDYAFIVESINHKVPDIVKEYYASKETFQLDSMLYSPGGLEWREELASPLCYASFTGLSESVHFLLNLAVNRGEECGHSDAVRAASYRGHQRIVEMLCLEGTDINAQGGHYGNALQAASYGGHQGIVELLLQNGADVNAQGGHYGNALQAASCGGHQGIVELLLQNGADVNAQGGEHGNALQAASFEGHQEIVQILLQNNADVNAQGGEYGNALQAASYQEYLRIVEILLQNGANIDAQGGKCGNALQAASYGERQEIVSLLLSKGANVNAQGGKYGNALQAASYGEHRKMVEILLESDVYTGSPGKDFDNTLQAASYAGHRSTFKMLLRNLTYRRPPGEKYDKLIRAALYEGQQKIVTLLLQYGANVNAQGGEYGTALQAASARGDREIVKVLLQNGAEVNAEGGRHGNAVKAASSGGHEAIVQLLLESGAIMDRQDET